jgi:hypothetical protein
VYVKPGLIPLCLAGVAVAAPLASGRLVPPPLAVATIATVGAIALVAAALLGWRVLRHRTGRPSLVAALCCLAIGTIVVLLLFIPPAPPGPRFNDVTTDPAEPPVFISGPAAGQAPPAQFAAWQRDAYPDLAPLVLPVEMTVARARVHAAVTAMPDWTLQVAWASCWPIAFCNSVNRSCHPSFLDNHSLAAASKSDDRSVGNCLRTANRDSCTVIRSD